MTNQTVLIDRPALLRNRRRHVPGRGDFLHDEAIIDVQDRLNLVTKSFKDVAIVTSFPDPWTIAFPDATIVVDDDVLDLAEQTYDLVIHGMCLHWANDPVGQLIQCRRALRPDGLFIGVLLGGETLAELRSVLAEAEIKVRSGLSPRVLPMAEIRDVGALLQRAGFALPVADSAVLKTRYDNVFKLMADLRAMGETNALSDRDRRFTPRQVFLQAADIYQSTFGDEHGSIPASFEQIFLTGWAPDDSQPKALRPGSATMRLADAIGATETNLND